MKITNQSDPLRPKSPRGGTELQLDYLKRNVDFKLLEEVQICTSVPERVPLHKDKVNILWQKNSWDQPNLNPWFSDKSNHHKYDWYVFNSHWNYEQFRKKFDIPTHRCVVIKNGISGIQRAPAYKKGQAIKIIHHNTPWRGLSVLLGAMQLVKNPLITLDVYSSTRVYGEHFFNETDKDYQELYLQATKLPNVNYIGYQPNEHIKDNLEQYQMYVYPSIFEETFCISLLECMAAGIFCIVNDFGALYETGAEFPLYVPYENDHRVMAQKFAFAIEQTANKLHENEVLNHLESQSHYANIYYGWGKIGTTWTKFLEGAISAKAQ